MQPTCSDLNSITWNDCCFAFLYFTSLSPQTFISGDQNGAALVATAEVEINEMCNKVRGLFGSTRKFAKMS